MHRCLRIGGCGARMDETSNRLLCPGVREECNVLRADSNQKFVSLQSSQPPPTRDSDSLEGINAFVLLGGAGEGGERGRTRRERREDGFIHTCGSRDQQQVE